MPAGRELLHDVRKTVGAEFGVVGVVSEGTWGLSWLTLLPDDAQAGPPGVRLLERRHLSVGVALPMGTLPLPRLVEPPVLVEITTGTKRPEAQHRLRSAQPPARTGDPQPVVHQMATGSLNLLWSRSASRATPRPHSPSCAGCAESSPALP